MGDISRQFRHLMWYVFAGSSGGTERVRIMGLLRDRPSNTRQISEKLDMDPSEVIHHINILVDNGMIELGGRKGESMFFVSDMFERDMSTFNEIIEKLGLNPKRKDIDWKDFRIEGSDSWLWGRGDD